jgi:hypothetical protein
LEGEGGRGRRGKAGNRHGGRGGWRAALLDSGKCRAVRGGPSGQTAERTVLPSLDMKAIFQGKEDLPNLYLPRRSETGFIQTTGQNELFDVKLSRCCVHRDECTRPSPPPPLLPPLSSPADSHPKRLFKSQLCVQHLQSLLGAIQHSDHPLCRRLHLERALTNACVAREELEA